MTPLMIGLISIFGTMAVEIIIWAIWQKRR